MPTLSRKPSVQLIQLGCAKNQVDSEEVLGILARDGFRVTGPGARADIVVINTCGFLEAAKAESLRVIRQAARRRERDPRMRLVVAGCLVQRCKDELARINGIDALVGVGQNDAIAGMVQSLAAHVHGGMRVQVADRPRHRWVEEAPRLLSTPPWSAYLKIAEGCSHACTFCTIPSIRGPYVSKPLDAVVREATQLARRGVVELNLVAQDTTRYGADLAGRPTLVDLVQALHEVDGLRWIRVFYAYPGRQIERLVSLMPGLPKLCRYVDMPLQHSHPAILRAMKRPGTGEAYLRLVRRMRERVPDLAIRTTLIAGFPGETEDIFEDLQQFVAEAEFDRLGVFTFSPERGTPAALMPASVSPAERSRRRDQLMRLQQRISLDRNMRMLGKEVDVLVERTTSRGGIGRTYRDGPEVDGTVDIVGPVPPPGSFVRVRITGADVYDLRGRVVASVGEQAHAANMEARR